MYSQNVQVVRTTLPNKHETKDKLLLQSGCQTKPEPKTIPSPEFPSELKPNKPEAEPKQIWAISQRK